MSSSSSSLCVKTKPYSYTSDDSRPVFDNYENQSMDSNDGGWHALQQPAGRKLDDGGVACGGLRELLPCIANHVQLAWISLHDMDLSSPSLDPR
ncbi:hypothetical protein ACFX1X_012926 [Malus domestica]